MKAEVEMIVSGTMRGQGVRVCFVEKDDIISISFAGHGCTVPKAPFLKFVSILDKTTKVKEREE